MDSKILEYHVIIVGKYPKDSTSEAIGDDDSLVWILAPNIKMSELTSQIEGVLKSMESGATAEVWAIGIFVGKSEEYVPFLTVEAAVIFNNESWSYMFTKIIAEFVNENGVIKKIR